MADTYRALVVREAEPKVFTRAIEDVPMDFLPDHPVLIRVKAAALNYKDALSAIGNKGVSRKFPHTPGIDAVGEVVESQDPRFTPGMEVIVTSYDLGMNTKGGMAQYIRVPGDWIVAKPEGLSLREAIIFGTAGLTAGIALHKMEKAGMHPDMGPVLVTGASGGVGSMAVAILAKAGYKVIASTGKDSAHGYLKTLGAKELLSRNEALDDSPKPLLKPRWSGVIDGVGGNCLESAIRACAPHGHVACYGLVGSPNLSLTVFPFILRGINLLGVDSAEAPTDLRMQVWNKLAQDWKIEHLELIAEDSDLEKLNTYYIDAILAGKVRGRVVVDLK